MVWVCLLPKVSDRGQLIIRLLFVSTLIHPNCHYLIFHLSSYSIGIVELHKHGKIWAESEGEGQKTHPLVLICLLFYVPQSVSVPCISIITHFLT